MANRFNRGTVMFQHAALIVAVVLGLTTISIYFRLILQGHWKKNADSFSQDFYGPTDTSQLDRQELDSATVRVTQDFGNDASGNRFKLETTYYLPEPQVEGANITTIN